MVEQLNVETPGQGLHEITPQVCGIVRASKVVEGLCTLYVRHTSASLLIQENADPSAKLDLERWLHLWEHRRRGSLREVVVHIGP
ncbi:MAG: YjbQ family protein [Pseudomonadota bacterium]|nr:YjbQ family protein [Pseudomonadota bacterium]